MANEPHNRRWCPAASELTLSVIWPVFCFSCLLLLGCAPIGEKKTRPSLSLPTREMNPGAVAVQVAVVQIDSDQQVDFQHFWKQLDQTKLPLQTRKLADKNGLRYAIMAPQVPAILDSLLQPRELDVAKLPRIHQQMAEKGLLESPPRLVVHQRVENDVGEAFEIPTSGFYAQKEWTVVDSQGRQQSGVDRNVKGVFRIVTYPHGDGSVNLKLQPEIHHGQSQDRFNVTQRNFLISHSQLKTKAKPLNVSIDLKPGETIVIAPVDPLAGLGGLMFGQDTIQLPSQPQPAGGRLVNASEVDALFAEIDRSLGLAASDTPLLSPTTVDSAAAEPATLEGEQPASDPIRPLFRFMMVRLVHVQADDLFHPNGESQSLLSVRPE